MMVSCNDWVLSLAKMEAGSSCVVLSLLVSIIGKSRYGKTTFEVKERVEVEFRPKRYDIIFDRETLFYKDVNIKQKECSGSGKGKGNSCKYNRPVPELCVVS